MTGALWTAEALRGATGGALDYNVTVRGVAIDSRDIAPGDLFVALRAERDGHDFAADAFARGAACAMVDRAVTGGPLLRVADTLEGLTALGAAARARAAAEVIAVTGSVGKTTTKDMLRVALAALGRVHAAAASHNNQWGVPLTLARLPPPADFAVIEIGMNNRGEIAPLAQLARPHIAVITTIGSAHIGHLGDQEAIAEEKGDILNGVEAHGTAVLPADSPFFARLSARAQAAGIRVIGHGESPGAEARLLTYAGDAEGGRAEYLVGGERMIVELGAPGRHVALNGAAVLGTVLALGLSVRRACSALAAFGAGAGRGRRLPIRVPGGEALLIDGSYNASTASIRAALAVLAAQPARRRIAVLGEMRELGPHGPALHAELAPDVAAVCDLTFSCGELMAHLDGALPEARRGAHVAHSALLVPLLRTALRPGDAVLVKGSLGSRMALVVEALSRAEDGSAAA